MRYFYFVYVAYHEFGVRLGTIFIEKERFPTKQEIINQIRYENTEYGDITIVNWKEFKSKEDMLNFRKETLR